jgi:TetR/AcrR family transcriptional regulator, cholesterol catabolism regulator
VARKPADQSVNKGDIIIAAAAVLQRNGYDATTMKDIAAQVNLTAASLYHHFISKDFLLLAVLEHGLSRAIAEIEPIANSIQPCADKLRAMIHTHIGGITANSAIGAAMVFEIRALMNAHPVSKVALEVEEEFMTRRDNFFRQRDAFENLFRRVIQDGVAAGEFRAVDSGIVAKAMLGAHNWVGVWYRETGRLSGEQIAAIMADTFITSLLAHVNTPA